MKKENHWLATSIPLGSTRRGRLAPNTYRHEGVTAIVEVEDREDHLGIAGLVALGPLTAEEVPVRPKFTAHLAAKTRVSGSQEHCYGVVARQSGGFLIGGIVEFERRRGQGLLVQIQESLAGTVGEDARSKQGEWQKDGGPVHGGRWVKRGRKKRKRLCAGSHHYSCQLSPRRRG